MNQPTVTVVDYGVGNLLSVSRAFEHCGARVAFARTAQEIAGAQKLILPGVGAFGEAMSALRERGLADEIRRVALSGIPFLGICLGMQLMLDYSFEFGEHQGLGLIPGEVTPIPKIDVSGEKHKIPHIGWTELVPPNPGQSWTDPFMDEVHPGRTVYFVHSYVCNPRQADHRLADAYYGGHRLSAIVKSGNLYGCQFHPEKSGPAGLTMLRNFIGL